MKLLDALKEIYEIIKWGVVGTYNFLKNSFSLYWAIIAVILALAFNVINVMVVMINWLLDMLQSVSVGSFNFSVGMGISKFLAIANTFFPVDEFCRFYVAWLTVYFVMTAIRWLKSFMPTINGWGINGD